MAKKPSVKKSASKVSDKAKQLKKSTSRAVSKKRKPVKKSNNNPVVGLYSNMSAKRRSKREEKAKRKAEYLATLPKSRVKRFFYRLHPKRLYHYWFSKRGAIMALKLMGLGFALCFILLLGIFAYFRRDLPDPREINARLLNQTTKFYDRTGEHLLFELYKDENRTIVEADQMSDHIRNATIAIEDKDFYEHGGFSVTGIFRAAWSNVRGSGTTQGGSTITQQFIKNSLLSSERTVTRKLKELILSMELERLYSKDEILTFYLNEIPYGPQEYGVEAAAQSFFRKPASKLGIAESAMLAALPQAPSFYSPYGKNTEDLIWRQQHVIDQMADQGYITQEQAEKAKKVDILAKITPIDERSLYKDIKAPHFVLEVQRQLEEEFGPSIVQTGGLTVITTLDWELQEVAEDTMKNNIQYVENPQSGGGSGDNAAMVSVDTQTGQVVAYVGSRDFRYPGYGSFDAATPKLGRQPGSSFKPFGYAQSWTTDRWGPDSVIYDTPTTFGDYKPNNFDFGFRGKMKVREALGESRNIPAVKALYIAGVQDTIETAKAMGNKSLGDADQYGLSLVLGAGEVKLSEHTAAYSTFGRNGKAKDQAYVLKITNAEGDVLKEWEDTEGEQAIDAQIAWLMTDALSDDAARAGTFGLGNPRLVVPGLTHTVKTGSTDRSVDGWMMGYSHHLTTGVWAGNHDSKPMDTITSWQTGPIFTEFMRRAHFDVLFAKRGLQDQEIAPRPDGIQSINMDSNTGYAATDRSGSTYVGLFPSWYKKQTPESTGTVVIVDKISGKKATECTPERAKEERKSSGRWPELLPDDPFFSLWARSAGYSSSGTITEEDDVHKCSDSLPGISLSSNKISDGVYELVATVSKGTHKLSTLNFKINGTIVSSISATSPGTYKYTHKFTSTGTKTIAAEVIDSVLYDNTSSRSLDVDAVYSNKTITINSPESGKSYGPGSVAFNWNSISGADEYEVCWTDLTGGDGTLCISTPDTTYNPGSGFDPGEDYSATIKAWTGGVSSGTVVGEGSVSFSTL